MENFLKEYFGDEDFQQEKLLGDGGHRLYTRIVASSGKTYILMSSGPRDSSLKDFVSIQKRLQKGGCLVPKIFKEDFSKGFLLMEDLESQRLEDVADQAGWKTYYQKALDQLIHLQKIPCKDQDARFDKTFLTKEVEVALSRLEQFVALVLQKKPPVKPPAFMEEMEQVQMQITETFFMFCHRDFHSKNLMLYKEGIYLLDFQDAGAGPWAYDLTSLVYDSYVSLTDLQKKDLIQYYLQKSQVKNLSLSQAQFLVELQFLQRGLKACGCFAGFYNADQKATHLKYIKPTLENLIKVAQNQNYKNIAIYLKDLKNLLQGASFDEISWK